MAAGSSSIELCERHPLNNFVVGGRRFTPLEPLTLQVDYDQGLWIVSLPILDAVGSSSDYAEAKGMLLDYIDFLWVEYVSSPEEELGETGKMLRELLERMFRVG